MPRHATHRNDIPHAPQRRRLLQAATGAALLSSLPVARSLADDTFEPKLGQHGKDVMWLPTPDALIDRLLRLAGLTSGETLVDLGAGDGRIVMAAARDFGANARGVEYDGRMVELARQQAEAAGLGELATFEQGDIFETDFSDASVVAMYLLPELNLRLRPTLMAMQPGTRLITHQFDMGNWQADQVIHVAHRPGYLWIVPANAGGTWNIDVAQGGGAMPTTLEIEQTFQKIDGVARFDDMSTSLRWPRLDGRHIAFTFADAAGYVREVDAMIEDDRMQGRISGPHGTAPFTARRDGEAPPIAGSGPASEEEMHAAVASLGAE